MPSPSHPQIARLWGRGAVLAAMLVGAGASHAQTGLSPASPTTPAPAASAADTPDRLRPTPKVTGPSDAVRSLDLNNPQPEGRVTPQIRIPIGKKPDARILQRRTTDTGLASVPNGKVNEAAAACEAKADEVARSRCRADLARHPAP